MNSQSTTNAQDARAFYLSSFDSLSKQSFVNEPAWLHEIRRGAIERFNELGFPHTRLEEWRFTNVRAIAETEYELAAQAGEYPAEAFEAVRLPQLDAWRIVLVDGVFSAELSSLRGLPEGVRVQSLAQALETDGALVEPYLARKGSYEDNPFAALNTAFMRDGALISIPQGVELNKPIHLVYLGSAGSRARAVFPRTLVAAGANSKFEIVETFAGRGENHLTNAVAEISLGEYARGQFIKFQREAASASHISNTTIDLARGATFLHHNLNFGGSLVRNDITASLNGEDVDCTLNGLIMGHRDQHVDNHTTLLHEKPHCRSWEMYKSILDDDSSGVFKGKIFVQKDAQKTDAKQTSQSLLMSDKASINAMPQLEIYADDVKCTHGATTGRLDENALFYARARGIGPEAARAMLTYAFAAEIVEAIDLPEVRDELEGLISERLPA
ncbi:MAG: Fe-S cluster assembly protein SufD [bacterium]|nr:Fe-S cluster assembly protein SufD [bacterium]